MQLMFSCLKKRGIVALFVDDAINLNWLKYAQFSGPVGRLPTPWPVGRLPTSCPVGGLPTLWPVGGLPTPGKLLSSTIEAVCCLVGGVLLCNCYQSLKEAVADPIWLPFAI